MNTAMLFPMPAKIGQKTTYLLSSLYSNWSCAAANERRSAKRFFQTRSARDVLLVVLGRCSSQPVLRTVQSKSDGERRE